MDVNMPSPAMNSASIVRVDTSSIAEALNRSASLNVGFPTRTIRITESEQSSRDNTPNPLMITIDDLVNRPRSNPRTRTPMRYESPLEVDAFRNERRSTPQDVESRRISIRPLAGAAVGTLPRTTRIDENCKGKSVKQGPSHRKIRKWNNEHFTGLAAEIAALNGSKAADVLLRAQRDAHLYQSMYDPKDHHRSKEVDRFMNDDGMKNERENFFEGHGPTPYNDTSKSKSSKKVLLTGDDMLNRIEQRLRRLVIRACHNSYAAAKVVHLFETFVINSFMGEKNIIKMEEGWWKDLLLQCPTISHRKDTGLSVVQFFFHPTLPTGGFHRLLLHAVCQFHGINVVSRTEQNFEYVWENQTTTNGTRSLTATASFLDNTSTVIRLLQHLGETVDDPIGSRENEISDQMAGLRV